MRRHLREAVENMVESSLDRSTDKQKAFAIDDVLDALSCELERVSAIRRSLNVETIAS